MPVRAVLFDFDGVIADTENHHVAAWQRTFLDMGWAVPDDVGVRASRAVATDASPWGWTAARGAGVRVVAVGHRRPRGEWSGDAPFAGDLTDHKGLLERLGIDS